MCENCLNKEVCKFRKQIENIEKTINSINKELHNSLNIKCNLKRK